MAKKTPYETLKMSYELIYIYIFRKTMQNYISDLNGPMGIPNLVHA